LKLVEIILTVETRLFFVLVEIFKIETFESRLGQVEIFIKIVEIDRDFRDLLRQTVEICQKVQVLIDFLISIQHFGTGK
jgi:hypothetical protein